jgi:hypothetical protein
VRCDGNRVKVTVNAPQQRVSVDGSRFARGRFLRKVRLAPGQRFRIAIKGSRTTTRSVRCLPADFPRYEFQRAQRPHASFYGVTSLFYAFFFDRNGVPVWWYRPEHRPFDLKVFDDGLIAWADYLGGNYGSNPAAQWEFTTARGASAGALATQGRITDFHDLQRTPNGNFLLVSYARRSGVDTSSFNGDASADVLDAEIQELTPAGSLLWTWNSKDHIGLQETGRWWRDPLLAADPHDIVHINAAEPLPDGDVLISLRHTDAVYRIDRGTGAVEWKLGGTKTPESLSIVGDPAAAYPLGGQHDVRALEDGSITIFDNRSVLSQPPRAVRYRVDEAGRTATLVESIRDRDAPRSGCCGSARRMSDGSWVIAWGFAGGHVPFVSEFDRKEKRTFKFALDGGDFTYRVFPVTGQMSRKQFRAGMNAQYPRRAPKP